MAQESPPPDKADGPEEPVDSESVKGIFGWETIDDTSIPYILRKGKKFVSVRIVERKLLSKYPNTFPDELGKKDPLISHFITEPEAKLLNEINSEHCDYEYGRNPFTVKDLIVDLTEFGEFFKVVKKTFPSDYLDKINTESPQVLTPELKSDIGSAAGGTGWIQINNTVSPFIIRVDGGVQVKYVPMHVIIFAAGLLSNQNIDGHQAALHECAKLNDACKAAGVDFTFPKSTKLLSINEVLQRCEVQLFDLPPNNPLQFARYLDPRSGHPSSCLLRSQMSQPAPMASSPALTPTSATPPQHSKADLMAHMAAINPFMPGAHQMDPSRFGVMGFMQMRPGGDASLMQQKLQGIPDMSQASGVPRPYWPGMGQVHPGMPQGHPGMGQGPPPAHMGNNARPNMSQKGSHQGSEMKPSLPPPYPYSSLPMQFKGMGMPDFSHPIFHQGPSGSGGQGTIRFPPPRLGMPQVPPSHLPHQMYGQFDSSLFQQQQQQVSENNSSSQQRQKRKSGSDQPSHPPDHNMITSQQALLNSLQASGRLPARLPVEAPSVAQARAAAVTAKPKGAKLSGNITACLVNSKSISCLKLESGPRMGNFCLVEAVSKLYFPSVPLAEFVKVLQMVLQVQLYECSDDEEAAFVQYYNLPVKKLKCNKIVRVEDLEKYFPQLNYMFSKFVAEPTPSDTPTPPSQDGRSSTVSPLKRALSNQSGDGPASKVNDTMSKEGVANGGAIVIDD